MNPTEKTCFLLDLKSDTEKTHLNFSVLQNIEMDTSIFILLYTLLFNF